MGPSPCCRKPEHLDIILSRGSHAATGYFSVVIFDPTVYKTCDYVSYSLLFLSDTDLEFKNLQRAVSGTLENFVCPIGKLTLTESDIKRKRWKMHIFDGCY